MIAQSDVARWRIFGGGAVKIIALLILYVKATHIPGLWTIGSFGKEADFLRSALATVLVIILAGTLLSASRWLDGRWGTVFWIYISISGILLIQDSVLAWAVWGI